jgi:cytochrome c oxidase subunit I
VVRCKGLVLAHLWVAFGAFGAAAVLGVWQMWVRSPLHAPYADPQNYFLSVTAHGTSMAYVLTTFFIMGFHCCPVNKRIDSIG